MARFLARRVLLAIATLFVVSVLIFVIMHVLPGDVALFVLSQGETSRVPPESELRAVREALGLNKPLVVQYAAWVGDIMSGDLGESYFRPTTVGRMVIERGPLSLEIAVIATVLSWVVGVLLGLVSGLRPGSVADYVSRFVSIIGLALPNFWLAMLVWLVLVMQFHWFPPILFVPPWQDPWTNIRQVWAPSVVLAAALTGYVARVTRSSIIDVIVQDFVRTAFAKGLTYRTIVARHVLKAALLPVVTLSSVQLSALLGATLVVETVFGIPGLGFVIVRGVLDRDIEVVQSLVLLFAAWVIIVNVIVDLLYGWLDPRVRVS